MIRNEPEKKKKSNMCGRSIFDIAEYSHEIE